MRNPCIHNEKDVLNIEIVSVPTIFGTKRIFLKMFRTIYLNLLCLRINFHPVICFFLKLQVKYILLILIANRKELARSHSARLIDVYHVDFSW